MKKPFLPTKICPACARPFAWRKKWAKDWPNVKFCSTACRTARRQSARGAFSPPLDKS